jgi:tRNA dimethylallyltransferase
MNKLIVILGPTASGKTDLSIKLAKKFNGEVVSADSRQVYKGMNIGTGKITKKETQGIPHYLLDISSPKKIFTVADYKKLAIKATDKITKKGKIPFIVGGTGFYIDAVLGNTSIPEVKPDWKLRKKLEKKSTKELYEILGRFDLARAKSIDRNNPRRLIRAIEIVMKTGEPVPPLVLRGQTSQISVLKIGIKKPKNVLKTLIKKRLMKRLKQGMLNEARKLHKSGVSWKRMEEFGLEYRYMAYYLQKKITYDEFINRLNKEIEHYAKRQITWFKRNKQIKWVNSYKQAEKLSQKFLTKS